MRRVTPGIVLDLLALPAQASAAPGTVVTGTRAFGVGDHDASVIRFRTDGERDPAVGERRAAGCNGATDITALNLFLRKRERSRG